MSVTAPSLSIFSSNVAFFRTYIGQGFGDRVRWYSVFFPIFFFSPRASRARKQPQKRKIWVDAFLL